MESQAAPKRDAGAVGVFAVIVRGLQSGKRLRFGYRVITAGAEPMISLPLIDFKRLKDPSIIHAF